METGHEAYERLTGKIFLDERTTLHLLVSHACSSKRLTAGKTLVSSAWPPVAVVAALPVMALIALFIYVTEERPVLFVHERVGLNGRPFRLLKFRSMRVEKATSSEWECDNEERITPLGRWLRKLTSMSSPALEHPAWGHGPRRSPPAARVEPRTVRSLDPILLSPFPRPARVHWVGSGPTRVRTGLSGRDREDALRPLRDRRPSLRRDLWVLLATAKIVRVGSSPLDREALPAAKTIDGEGSVHWRLKGFARLLAAVVVLFTASGALRLMAQIWINTRPMLMPPATAMARKSPEPTSPPTEAMAIATGPRVPTSPATAAATGPPDPASLDAAAARAKAAVQRYEIASARILKAVLAKRIGAGTFVDGIEQPHYQAEVHVEIPRSFDKPIRRKYP